jgi:D-alanyl-D-alanine dipeptidase
VARRAPALAIASAFLFALPYGVGLAGCGGGGPREPEPPPGPPLVAVADLDDTIVQDIRYAGSDNFVGAPIPGYEAPRCLLVEPAARALVAVQADLRAVGMGLQVFDCYRPKRAVDRFVRWAGEAGERTKDAYYPRVPKDELVARGYIAAASAHSRGATVDATLVAIDSWGGATPLDMGTPFDFFDERSHGDSADVSAEARENRRQLRDAMQRRGFRPLAQEWWHFTYQPEPYPDRSFDVPVR